MSRNNRHGGNRGLTALGLVFPAAFSAALFQLACVGEPDGDKPTKEQQDELVETICEKRVECCSEFYDESSRDTCRATQGSVVGAYFNRAQAAVDRGDAEYDAGEL